MKNRLHVLRAERRLSQATLAQMLDVSRQTVNAIEVGKHDPSLTLAFRIAAIFDSPIEDIFFGLEEAIEALKAIRTPTHANSLT